MINNAHDIRQISTVNFQDKALELFEYQYSNVNVYRDYCDLLKISKPKNIYEIPFLPIQFFKSHKVLNQGKSVEKVFKSSGTTAGKRSQHFIHDIKDYEYSFLTTFNHLIIDPQEAIIVALLPNYIEQGDSSLVYMVDFLINESGHEESGFYLNKIDDVSRIIARARLTERKIVVIGVSFALLDLAEKGVDMSEAIVIETGGMKGRRKEIIRSELHTLLKSGLNVEEIYSEYGMTELLSQGYTDGSEYFRTPSWMDVLIRDINDPMNFVDEGRSGGVNVIDLANVHSCAFIATDDLGVKDGERFKILGRFDQSDIRGCNLLVN